MMKSSTQHCEERSDEVVSLIEEIASFIGKEIKKLKLSNFLTFKLLTFKLLT